MVKLESRGNSEVKELRNQGFGRAIYMDIDVTKNDDKAWVGEDNAEVGK